jgi:hypothetical protein|tara:strand:+ start:440 stop:1180 length:741 start_codon:yes stop_codon:yes gene_type:complete
MKNTMPLLTILGAASMMTSPLSAGELSGSISFDYNSHFISYGFDVWGGGKNPSGESTFNPSVSIDYQVNDQWTLSSGFWLDVNDNTGDFETVETDIWFGASYTTGITTISGTFQNWQYGGVSEEVFDLGVSFDTFLSPSVMLHHRLDEGASGGFDGTFLLIGAEHTFELSDSFSITVPVAVGFALSEFHTTETGYGYASIGLQGSYALNDSTSLNVGATYYDTDDAVVGNVDDSFITYNAGISISF